MKRFLGLCILIAVLGCVAVATEWMLESTSCHSGVTNTDTKASANGWIESIYFDIPANATQVVTLATSKETFMTITNTGDTTERLRLQCDGKNGGAISGEYMRMQLVNETVTMTTSKIGNYVHVYRERDARPIPPPQKPC